MVFSFLQDKMPGKLGFDTQARPIGTGHIICPGLTNGCK